MDFNNMYFLFSVVYFRILILLYMYVYFVILYLEVEWVRW